MSSKQERVQTIDEEIQVLPELENDSTVKVRAQKRFLSPFLSKKIKPIPEEDERNYFPQNRNPISYLFFWWLNPIYKIGYRRTIESEDLWKLNENQKVENHFEKFELIFNEKKQLWKQKHLNVDENSWPIRILILSLFSTFKIRSLISISLCFLNDFTIIFIPMVNKKLIEFVENRNFDRSISLGPGIGYAICNSMMTLLAGMFFNHLYDVSMRTAIDARSVLIKLVLVKSMKLSSKGKNQFTEGRITSLVGNDLARIEFAITFFFYIFAIIPSLCTTMAMLIINLGPSALAGIALMIIASALQGVGARKLVSYRTDANQYTDSRVTYIKEILNNFKIIKFYSWEDPYFKRVEQVRNKEMKVVRKMKIITTLMIAFSLGLPQLSTMTSFLVLYKLRGIANVASIFASLTWFNVMSEEIAFLPQVFASSADAYTSLKRVSELLKCDEDETKKEEQTKNPDANLIQVTDASFQWEKFDNDILVNKQKEQELEAYELQSQLSNVDRESIMQENFNGFDKLNLTVSNSEFIVVTGLIGSGKTSFLRAISGNMKQNEGELKVNGSLLFCGEPWIQSTSVRENIVFGSTYDEGKYKRIVEACALISDFKLLPAGDRTEIGERGITLSGGQKARINLARAIYADKDIILLDDILSAVDAKVAKHIMQNCILGLLKNKTRILATHQLSLVKSCDRVIFLNKDGSVDCGTFEQLKKRNHPFERLMEFDSEVEHKQEEKKVKDVIDSDEIDNAGGESKLTSEEEKGVNLISMKVYKHFILEGSGKLKLGIIPILLCLTVFTTFFEQFTNVWLTFWTEGRFEIPQSTYLGLYIFFGFMAVVVLSSQLMVLTLLMNNASRNIINDSIKRLLRAPMSFMDVTPMGRVLNRFTKDTEVLDNELFMNTLSVLYPLAYLCGVTIMTVVYLPWIAIALPVLFAIFIGIADFSQATAREIKRIEATKRSFIFNNFNEVLNGLATIKAYKAEQRFIDKNDFVINKNNEAYYLTSSCQRWLAIQLTVVSSIFGFLVAMLAATGVFHLSASTTGLLLSAMLSFYGCLTAVFRSITAFEISMNSVERLNHYSTNLEQEAPAIISDIKPPPHWPSNPSIEFHDASMSYRPGLPLVLNKLSFKINAGERIGICGRTGAGKSSIMNALYRISELSAGKIVIDDVDISKVGLADLRTKLSIIPQDNVLFKGTIRYNLDPFGEHPDELLSEALRKSGLYKQQESSSMNKFDLDLKVEENGINFSLGEKQLVALARALARKAKVLILDEATSSVDYETDDKIQQTLRNEFQGYTVLCIAHRLKTILDYDRIIVLDRGEAVEFDSPKNLYQNSKSLFRDMCEQANISTNDFL